MYKYFYFQPRQTSTLTLSGRLTDQATQLIAVEMAEPPPPPRPPHYSSAPPAVARRRSQPAFDVDAQAAEGVRLAQQRPDLGRATTNSTYTDSVAHGVRIANEQADRIWGATNRSATRRKSRRDSSASTASRSRSTTPRPLPTPPLGERQLYDQPTRFYERYNQGRIQIVHDAEGIPRLREAPTAFNLREMANNAATYSPVENSGPVNRAPASPASSSAGQVNGNGVGSASYMTPPQVGHQQDLIYLYGQIQELSGLLKENRDKVTTLTEQARRIAVCLDSVSISIPYF